MKKLGNIFFYVLIVIFTSIATFFALDSVSAHPIWLDIFQKPLTKSGAVLDTVIDPSLEDFIQNIDTHSAAIDYNYELDEFCKSDYDICSIVNIIDSSNQLAPKNIYYYHLLIGYVIKKIWSYGYKDILDHLYSVNVNNKVHKTRWYASAHSVNLNIWLMLSYAEFFKVFTHEFWHTFDLWYIVGDNKSLDPNYTEFGRKKFPINDPSILFYSISRDDEHTMSSDSSYKDFVSWYGMTDIFEDFAETYNFYLNYHDVFANLSIQSSKLKAKYDYMKKLFGDNYFRSGKEELSLFKDVNFRPYDTTRF